MHAIPSLRVRQALLAVLVPAWFCTGSAYAQAWGTDEAAQAAAIALVLMDDQERPPAAATAALSASAPEPASAAVQTDTALALVPPTRAEIEALFDRAGDSAGAMDTFAVADPAVDPLTIGLAVAEDRLDRVRGGFDAGNGLMISFGIERAVYVNGDLVTSTSLNVSDLGKVSPGQARPGGDTAAMTLIQNGPGNTFLVNPSASSVGTVIQNTLNDQKIQNITSINAVANSAQVFRGLQLRSTLSGALTSALRR